MRESERIDIDNPSLTKRSFWLHTWAIECAQITVLVCNRRRNDTLHRRERVNERLVRESTEYTGTRDTSEAKFAMEVVLHNLTVEHRTWERPVSRAIGYILLMMEEWRYLPYFYYSVR